MDKCPALVLCKDSNMHRARHSYAAVKRVIEDDVPTVHTVPFMSTN